MITITIETQHSNTMHILSNDVAVESELLYAIQQNHLHGVQSLLQQPNVIERINIQDSFGKTALMTAIVQNHLDIVKALLKIPEVIEGINITDHEGQTAYEVAEKNKCFHMTKEISECVERYLNESQPLNSNL